MVRSFWLASEDNGRDETKQQSIGERYSMNTMTVPSTTVTAEDPTARKCI